MRLSYRLQNLRASAAPPDLRWRILAALDAEDTAKSSGTGRRSHVSLWASALATVALILLLFRIPDVANRDAMASLVDQATLHLDGKGSFASTDPAELESWLEARIGYPISVPAIENAVLVGGRVAELDKVPSAALLYTIGGADLTYFALPASSGIGSDIPPDTIRSVSTGGFNMAVWTEADGPRAVVSAMDKEKVVVVARECKRNATGS